MPQNSPDKPKSQQIVATGKEARTKSISAYSPKEYWDNLASSGGPGNSQARAVVLHPGVPDWFNRALDRLQAKAWLRALRRCGLGPGARVLDVGCGTGRWLYRLERQGARPTGTDRTEAMLQIARKRLHASALVAAEAQRLPFADASFDAVLAVTVVQHIPRADQKRAISEMARVARPGGSVVLLDLIRGTGLHVFPQPPEEWMSMGLRSGLNPVGWFGQEFLPFDRLFRRVALSLRGLAGAPAADHLPASISGTPPDLPRRAYWAIRGLAMALSMALEPLVERFFPQKFATHGVFIFRKLQSNAPAGKEIEVSLNAP